MRRAQSCLRWTLATRFDFEFCKHVMQDFASSLGPSKTEPWASNSGLRQATGALGPPLQLLLQTQISVPLPRNKTEASPSLATEPAMRGSGSSSRVSWGQASRFRVGEPVFRFHASDSEASSPSVASSGFAQVLENDFRFFASEDEASPAASSDSLSSSLSRPGLRYRHPQPWVPIDIRPRYMYSAGLLTIIALASAEARWPMIFQSLEGILFGSQCLRLDSSLPKPSRVAASCSMQ